MENVTLNLVLYASFSLLPKLLSSVFFLFNCYNLPCIGKAVGKAPS